MYFVSLNFNLDENTPLPLGQIPLSDLFCFLPVILNLFQEPAPLLSASAFDFSSAFDIEY